MIIVECKRIKYFRIYCLHQGFGLRFGERESEAEAERWRERSRERNDRRGTAGGKAADHSALGMPLVTDAFFCGTEPARL
jgi:hypothetical protein